jgi:hypothetical protein
VRCMGNLILMSSLGGACNPQVMQLVQRGGTPAGIQQIEDRLSCDAGSVTAEARGDARTKPWEALSSSSSAAGGPADAERKQENPSRAGGGSVQGALALGKVQGQGTPPRMHGTPPRMPSTLPGPKVTEPVVVGSSLVERA